MPCAEAGLGGAYDPETDTWSTIANSTELSSYFPTPPAWSDHYNLNWSSGLSTWLGQNNITGKTISVSDYTMPLSIINNSTIWTGEKVIIWGGSNGGFHLNTGFLFEP